jgi:hypothetical protein
MRKYTRAYQSANLEVEGHGLESRISDAKIAFYLLGVRFWKRLEEPNKYTPNFF